MATAQKPLREVRWTDFFSWLVFLGRSFRLATAPRVLLLTLLGMLATTAGWRLIDLPFLQDEDDPAVTAQEAGADARFTYSIHSYSVWPWNLDNDVAPLPGEPVRTADAVTSGDEPNPLFHAWDRLSDPFVNAFQGEYTLKDFVYYFLCGLWAVVVWSFIGGAITRIAAVALAREDRLGFRAAIGYGLSKWLSYLSAPLFPMLGVFIAAVPLLLVGLLFHFDFGVLLAAILWPLVILGGLVMAVILLGLLFGWPLMWGTISTEGTDSFDAMSRSYAYVLQRPLHYFFYALIASILGMLGWMVVTLLAVSIVELTHWGVSWGVGGQRWNEVFTPPLAAESSSSLQAGREIILFLNACVLMLPAVFMFSYFWTSSTAIYFLLRHHVDQTELDEIAVDEDADTYSLPMAETLPGGPAASGHAPAGPVPPGTQLPGDDLRGGPPT